MRIAFVLQDLFRGGAQYVTAILARALASQGHTVDVVVSGVHRHTQNSAPHLKPFALTDAVNMYHLSSMRASRNILSLLRYYLVRRPDAVLVMSSNYLVVSIAAARMAGWRRRPSVISVEHSGGLGMPVEASRVTQGDVNLLGRLIPSDFGARNAAHCVAVSCGVERALITSGAWPEDKVSTIFNPVVDDLFISMANHAARHHWLVEKKWPVIVAAGSHVPLKGYDVLLYAFKTVCEALPCRLIIFGEGAQTPELQSLSEKLGVAEIVSLPGHIENLPAELRRADVFVVSSHCESFSVVLVQALACGVPVVSTDCPVGPREILNDGAYGCLVPPNDPIAMAHALIATLRGERRTAPVESWRKYEAQSVARQYVELIQQVARRPIN